MARGDTATSHGRIFVIEVMGREYGLLACQTGIATGAEEVLLPEIEYDMDELCRRIDSGYARGKRHALIVVRRALLSLRENRPRLPTALGISGDRLTCTRQLDREFRRRMQYPG